MTAAPPAPPSTSPDLRRPVQRQFQFAAWERHSLARLESAIWWLEINELEVFDLIADGALVAFNLAGKGAQRRLPGIWSHSLKEHQQAQAALNATVEPAAAAPVLRPAARPDHPTAEVLADILPPGRRDLRFREVLRALGIKRRLLHDLLDSALLAAVPGTGDKVSKAPLITRPSVVEFLTGRRM